MSEILGNDGARSKMAANARRLARQSFSSEAVVSKLEEIYSAVSDRGV
jgi:glycosyltransferase involved in cell wall biosynthesis